MRSRMSIVVMGILLFTYVVMDPMIKGSDNVMVNAFSGETETIDDFSVHPKNRWNVSTNDNDVFVDMSNAELDLYSNNNETAGSNDYFMTRDMNSPADIIDVATRHDLVNLSNIEFYRDIKSDPADFNDSDDFSLYSGATMFDVVNGMGSFIMTSDWDGLSYQYSYDVSLTVFHTLKVRMRANESILMQFRFYPYNSDNNRGYMYINQTLTTAWSTYTFELYDAVIEGNFSSYDSIGRLLIMSHTSHNDYNVKAFIDDVQLFGYYDYATVIDGEVEDTFNWADSTEYYTDQEDNEQEFSHNEGWTAGSGDSISYVSGWLKIEDGGTAQGTLSAYPPVGSIDASIYTHISLEWYCITTDGSKFIDYVEITDNSGNRVGIDNDNGGNNTKMHCFLNIGSDPDWTATESRPIIKFDIGGSNTQDLDVYVNFVYLYDSSLGDVEGFSAWGGKGTYFVHPDGYFQYSTWTVANDYNYIRGPDNLNIDYDIFDSMTFRVKMVDDAGLGGRFRPFVYVQDGGLCNNASQYYTLNDDTWTDITINFVQEFSGDTDWDNTHIRRIGFYYYEKNVTLGNFEGLEQFYVDHIVLKGTKQSSKSTFGLVRRNVNSNFLLNCSVKTVNSSYNRIEVMLPDRSGELAYYYYSSYFRSFDGYYDWRVQYDMLQSDLRIIVWIDNSTELIDITYPADFLVATGNKPSLFSTVRMPACFISLHVSVYTQHHFVVDSIDASFTESTWYHEGHYTHDEDITYENYDAFVSHGGVIVSSYWSKSVPYLDAVVSGFTVNSNTTNGAQWSGDSVAMGFKIFAVDADDGELHKLYGLHMSKTNIVGGVAPERNILSVSNHTDTIYSYDELTNNDTYVSFKINTQKDRSVVVIKGYFYPDWSMKNESIPFYCSQNVSDVVDSISQEFVIQTYFTGEHGGPTECKFYNFQVYRRYRTEAYDPLIPTGTPYIPPNFHEDLSPERPSDWLGGFIYDLGVFLGGILEWLIGTIMAFLADPLGFAESTFLGILGLPAAFVNWFAGVFHTFYDSLYPVGVTPIDFYALANAVVQFLAWGAVNALQLMIDLVVFFNHWFKLLGFVLFFYCIMVPISQANSMAHALQLIIDNCTNNVIEYIPVVSSYVRAPAGLVMVGLLYMVVGW